MTFSVERVEDLRDVDISKLVNESEVEGYRFLMRLVNEYVEGTNTFNKPGEALFCIRNESGEVVAIGGINQSPLSDDKEVARLRRFYVLRDARRQGVGSLLVKEIINHSKGKFKRMTLRTDSSTADSFYRANGFGTDDSSAETTHVLVLV
jgi:GNAT superfamily N-acetyltransferase